MWPLDRAENKITRRKKHDFKYMPNIICRQGYKTQHVPLGHYRDAKCFPAKIAAQIRRCDQLRNIRTENRASKSVTRSRKSTHFLNSHLCWLIANWFSRSFFILLRRFQTIGWGKSKGLGQVPGLNLVCLHREHVPLLWELQGPINDYVIKGAFSNWLKGKTYSSDATEMINFTSLARVHFRKFLLYV